MELHLGADDHLRLVDPDNFRAFKLVVEQPREKFDHVKRAVSGAILLTDADTAWVSEMALRDLSGHPHDHAWQHQLAEMIEKAKPHGWIDEANQAIKAHVEWRG
jgi:hypothetical protein